jgi:hypothetical protein
MFAALVACTPPAPPAPPTILATPYDGVTRCGSYAPIATPPAPRPLMPEREPMSRPTGDPSFVMPRIEAGDLDATFVQRGIESRAGAFRACFMAHGRDVTQRVTLEFVIGVDGAVGHIAVHGNDPQLDACLCERTASLHYRPIGDVVRVTYPLWFYGNE